MEQRLLSGFVEHLPRLLAVRHTEHGHVVPLQVHITPGIVGHVEAAVPQVFPQDFLNYHFHVRQQSIVELAFQRVQELSVQDNRWKGAMNDRLCPTTLALAYPTKH